ncbi:hypothetical protein [Nocardiopsis sp. NPDC006938]|uniref:hypothetical protein n=1 Tax=Nocardiopsis sp. NPDC006938 TaxID=3364337 RepID=UPI0036827EC6
MSSAEDRYRDAEKLAQEVDEEARHRRESRARELERLKRLHAEEAEEDRHLSQYARAMRAVRQHQLRQEPAQMRRSLIGFSGGFVLIALVGAVMVWMLLAQMLMDQGAPGWAGHGAGALYTAAFGAAMAGYSRSCWARPTPPRPLVLTVWALVLLPVPVMAAAAWVGWMGWTVLVFLVPILLCGYGGIFACGTLPKQYRQIEAQRET